MENNTTTETSTTNNESSVTTNTAPEQEQNSTILSDSNNDIGEQTKSGEAFDASTYEWVKEDGVDVDDIMINSFKEIAKEVNFTKEQVEKLNAWNNKELSRQREVLTNAEKKYIEESSRKLREDWGGDYDKNISLAKKAVKMLDSKVEGIGSILTNTAIGNMPEIIKALSYIGDAISDDSIAGTTAAHNNPTEKSIGEVFYGKDMGRGN